MKLIYLTLIVLSLILGFVYLKTLKWASPEKISFEVFEVAEKRDVIGMGSKVYGHSYFLVNNYKDNPQNRRVLDSFVCTIYNPSTIWIDTTIEEIQFSFFKKTKKTNSEYLRQYPGQFYRVSLEEDYICRYRFPLRGKSEIEYWDDGFPVEFFPGLKCN